ncbi:hypothetical protein ID866_10533, partial [Astraeus odoratus]
ARRYVEDKRVDPRPLISGIALGLRYLHNHTLGPIFHGNLKGHNVFISADGEAVLSDFGLSRLFNSSLDISHPSSIPGQHHAGSALNWMAPEILDTGEVSTEADVWAFGMTVLVGLLFAMFCAVKLNEVHLGIVHSQKPI